MKKILALILATVMLATMAMSAVVYGAGDSGSTTSGSSDKVTITVNRDSTYDGETTEAGRAYTWYKIFSATYNSSVSNNASGYDASGTANFNDGSGTKGIAYTASAKVAAALGTWTLTSGTSGTTVGSWTPADPAVACFALTPIAGSTNYSVAWTGDANVATLQAAALWLINNGAYDDSGEMTFNGSNAWTAEVDKGYYVIQSTTGGDSGTTAGVGANLIAATTDININEKNAYPPISKTQADEDRATLATDEKGVAIGDVLTYNVTVTIPATAKVGDTIEVYDKPTGGLSYNSDSMVIKIDGTEVKAGAEGSAVTTATPQTGDAWRYIITVTSANLGKDVTFDFTMTVTADALVDTGRENEAGLKYGDEYEAIPKTVSYTTYFTGIRKTNGEKPLEGVKFTLKENETEFKVSKTDDGYYIPDANGSSEVVTDSNGLILIRGLDDDKTYTLTETYTLPGYNMLEEDVTLVLVEDTTSTSADTGSGTSTSGSSTSGSAFDSYTADDWTEVVNNQGSVLPSTGGIGTTIFYIVGGLLAVGAGVILVTKKRMSKEDV